MSVGRNLLSPAPPVVPAPAFVPVPIPGSPAGTACPAPPTVLAVGPRAAGPSVRRAGSPGNPQRPDTGRTPVYPVGTRCPSGQSELGSQRPSKVQGYGQGTRRRRSAPAPCPRNWLAHVVELATLAPAPCAGWSPGWMAPMTAQPEHRPSHRHAAHRRRRSQSPPASAAGVRTVSVLSAPASPWLRRRGQGAAPVPAGPGARSGCCPEPWPEPTKSGDYRHAPA